MIYAHKKSVELLVFIGIFEVFDYLSTQLQRSSPRQTTGAPLPCPGWNLKLSKFQRFQSLAYFAIFYSMMCI